MFSRTIDNQVELRLLEPKHAEALFQLVSTSRKHLRPWLPWLDKTQSVEDSHLFIRNSMKDYAREKGLTSGIWVLGTLAGVIGYENLDLENRSASIGYWLGEDHLGEGIATRSCGVLIEHLFLDREMNRVEIRCAAKNFRSQGIPKRLGFRQEGTLREAERLYDEYVDLYVFGLLRGEWERASKEGLKASKQVLPDRSHSPNVG